MTGATNFRGSTRIAAGFVTTIASQITVRAQQGITGLLFVIELPEIPGVWCMTVLTLRTQRPFMMIIRLMTADAVGGGTDKLPLKMAAFASDDLMHADQRELREIVVKPEYGRPALGDMTGCTYLHFRLLVNIIRGMTDCAVPRQRVCQGAGVATDTNQLRVRAGKRESRFGPMVEFDLAPGLILMTGFTLLAIATMVDIVIRMTAVATGRGIVLHGSAGMAGAARNLGVLVGQGKAGSAVIEHGLFPTVHAMAGIALLTIFTGVHVSGLVTTDTGHVTEFIHLPRMTAAAGHLTVQALQRKPGG